MNTPSSRKRKHFIFGLSNILIVSKITNCCSLDIEVWITFIKSSQLFCTKYSCWCNVVVFCPMECQGWCFGIFQDIHALNVSNQIQLFEWIGPVTKSGTPDFVHDKSDIAHHFSYKEFSGDTLQLLFVNQFRGTPICNLLIWNTCRSEVDGGTQCLNDDPDLFNPIVLFPICCNPSQLETLFDSIGHWYDDVPFSKTYFKSIDINHRLKNINQRVRSNAPQAVKDWNYHAAYSTCSNQMGLFFVVTNNKLSEYKKEQSVMLHSFLRDKFLVPDLALYDDENNPFQFFSPMTAKQRSHLEAKCNCGVSPLEFDEIVTNLSDRPKSVVLLLTKKMKISQSNYHQFNNFHQVFAGGGLPTIDDMFKTFHVPNSNISVHWIFCTSTRFNQYAPLSTGCFDIKFHEIQVIPEFIDIINNAVGKKGLFPTRSRARHLGSCPNLGE